MIAESNMRISMKVGVLVRVDLARILKVVVIWGWIAAGVGWGDPAPPQIERPTLDAVGLSDAPHRSEKII